MGQAGRMNLFERYLTVWVAACMGAGSAREALPGAIAALRDLEFGKGARSTSRSPCSSG